MDTIFGMAREIQDEIIAIRRDIHAHPELGRQEVRTARLITEKLEEIGVDTIENPTPTSVVATVTGTGVDKGGRRCVAIRTDIDALPVSEDTGLEFASCTPGIMHACGHDIHCAMMIGNARILASMRDKFSGTVKLIFQHSEDTLPGGSRELIETGVMNGVDAILGLHVTSTENDEIGVIGIKEGAVTTSADNYAFNIIGTGGHGSQPHKVPDPILAASQMIVLFQQVQARSVAPLDASILMMNEIRGGSAPNIITDRVFMQGNARAYTPEVRKTIEESVYKIAKGVEEFSGCRIEVDALMGYDPCYNDPVLFEEVKENLEDVLGADKVQVYKEPLSFSEDFSFYSTLTGIPAFFMMLHAGNLGEIKPLHNAQITFSEDAIPYGMTAMVSSALKLLGNK